MEKNNIMIAIASLVGVFVFIAIAYLITSKPQPSSFPEMTEVKDTDHTKWSDKNEIILVEYSDFQCPGCGQYFSAIKAMEQDPEIGKTLMDNITFVYRHFPLDSIHPNARISAYAAEAAGNQGKFFEMHDLLFTNQNAWSESDKPEELFKQYAESLELDLEQFEEDINTQEIKDKVQADMVSGNDVNVRGTPTFFLNGQQLQVQSFEQLESTLLEAINNKEG